MFIAYFGMAKCVSQLSNPAITPTHLVSWIGLLTEVDNSKQIFTKYTRHGRFTRCICFSFLLPTPSAPRHRTLSRPSITGFGTIPRRGMDGYITSPCRIVLHAWLSCIRLVTRMERRSRIVVVFYLFWRTRTAAPSLSWVWYITAPSLRRHVFVLSRYYPILSRLCCWLFVIWR